MLAKFSIPALHGKLKRLSESHVPYKAVMITVSLDLIQGRNCHSCRRCRVPKRAVLEYFSACNNGMFCNFLLFGEYCMDTLGSFGLWRLHLYTHTYIYISIKLEEPTNTPCCFLQGRGKICSIITVPRQATTCSVNVLQRYSQSISRIKAYSTM